MERRLLQGSDLRVSASGKLTGYAALWNVWSEDLGGFKEKINRGTFARGVRQDVRALFNHNPNFVLGRTKSGTMALKEDHKGLHYEIDLPDTQAASDLRKSIKRGDVNQSSFSFSTREDSWNSERTERTLLDVDLYDVSPVTFPAYTQTSVSARSFLGDIEPSRSGVYVGRGFIQRPEDPSVRDAISLWFETVARQLDERKTVHFNPFIGPPALPKL
jgi:HK97 family phage prohead protease